MLRMRVNIKRIHNNINNTKLKFLYQRNNVSYKSIENNAA